jgi:hypothetical protein
MESRPGWTICRAPGHRRKDGGVHKKLAESEKNLAKPQNGGFGLLAGGVAHDLNNILSGIAVIRNCC